VARRHFGEKATAESNEVTDQPICRRKSGLSVINQLSVHDCHEMH